MSARLVIGTSSSRCDACGKGCDPRETHHWTQLGYGNHSKHGCGELFTDVTTDYVGINERIAAMRPDLPFIDPLAALSSGDATRPTGDKA